MSGTMVSKTRALRELSLRDATAKENERFYQEVHSDTNDRGACILLSADVENALDNALLQVILPSSDRSELFGEQGPLSTFSRKITMARAVGITGDVTQCGGLDGGIDPLKYNGLWFEQVIQQNVRPQIEGLHIHPVPLGNGNNAYVLTIPAAQSRAPHQLTKECVYYRRRNFRNDKMEDYEIREAMNRARIPVLDVVPAFKGQLYADQSLISSTNGGRSDNIDLEFIVSNLSSQPAEYAVLIVGVDLDIQIVRNENFVSHLGVYITLTSTLTRYAANLGFPASPPLFKENPESGATFEISVPDPQQTRNYALTTEIRTPGYSQKKNWLLVQQPPHLYLRPLDGAK
jgi:hypothetical protein